MLPFSQRKEMNENKSLILIVDDNPQNLQFLGNLLRENGYNPVVAQSGAQALAFLKRENPDLILLDIMMPEMDGYEVCQRLKADKSTQKIPVIFLTAKTETDDLVKGFESGAVDYITKPFGSPELLTRINTHILIKDMQRRLEKHNDELETRVKERTAELEESLERLKLTQSDLIQSEKMAALGSIVAGVTHEISTPLGVAYTEASFLGDKSKELTKLYEERKMTAGDFEKYLSILKDLSDGIIRNLDRATSQMNSFKEISVDQSSERQRVFNLKEYIEEILLNLRSKLKRTKHQITINCPDDLVINSYPGAFSQIVTNFITNTLLHGFDGIEQGEILFDVSKENNVLYFCYSDNGLGMEESIVRQVFDPFFTTKRNEGGSGLGMNIVYSLVTQKLKGHIECESSPGKGTQFSLRVPIPDRQIQDL